MENSQRDYKQIKGPIKSIGEFGASRCKFMGPKGVKVDRWTQNIYVADGMANRIQVFSSQLEFLFECGVKEEKKYLFIPSGICLTDRLVFIATGVVGMYIFTLEGELVTSFYPQSKSIYRTIKAVAVDEDGKCYVCDRAGNQVVVLYNGLPTAEVFVQSINRPCDIKIFENTIVVLKGSEKMLSVFSREGELLREFLTRSGMASEFFDIDRWGNALINDSIDCKIKIHNPSGDLIHQLTGNFFNNKGIAIDGMDRIISVCEYEINRLKIF